MRNTVGNVCSMHLPGRMFLQGRQLSDWWRARVERQQPTISAAGGSWRITSSPFRDSWSRLNVAEARATRHSSLRMGLRVRRSHRAPLKTSDRLRVMKLLRVTDWKDKTMFGKKKDAIEMSKKEE